MNVFRNPDAVSVKRGEEFGIALDVLSSGGYEWQVTDKLDFIALLKSEIKVSNAVGGESEQILHFRASEAGEGVLHLVRKRPWDSKPEKTLSIKIKAVK